MVTDSLNRSEHPTEPRVVVGTPASRHGPQATPTFFSFRGRIWRCIQPTTSNHRSLFLPMQTFKHQPSSTNPDYNSELW